MIFRKGNTLHDPAMPMDSYYDPAYSNDYWRSPTWLNVACFAFKGLKQYGYDETADGMREYILIYDLQEQRRNL